MKKVLAMTLAVLMILSVMPMSAFANTVSAQATGPFTQSQLTVITDDESTLAPGVNLNELTVYDKNGDRVEMYITTVDTTVDTVGVYANYMDNQNQSYGLQTLSAQVAAMEANYEEPFKIVAGINASYYNTGNGKPTGAFVMEGIDVTTEAEGNNFAFFAVLKDGTYMIGAKGEYSSYKGQIKEAIGGYIHIVKDGAIVSGLDAKTKYPRQTLGLTADGKLILMTADGSQAPQTVGLTVAEQAQVMLDLGCVEAIHLDGGNSATFGGIREGTDKFVLLNSPSGQSERAVSNTLVIASTAVSDGTFDHTTVTGEYEYFAPNSTYTFGADGVDAGGGPAEIPAELTWALSDTSFGTITDGKFVSNGKLGDVEVQTVYNGKVVGSKAISIVDPTSIGYDATEKTVPYGKTMAIPVIAMYGINEVYVESSAFTLTVAAANAGSFDGFNFTATTDETIKTATVTATYKNVTLDSATVAIKFGKASEVLFNFEDGDVSDWKGTDVINDWIAEQNKLYPNPKEQPIITPQEYGNNIGSTNTNTFLASSENGGKVKNGKYSLGVTLDRLYSDSIGDWIYNYLYYTGDTQVWRDVANGNSAVRVGMWVYFPETSSNTAFRICRTFKKAGSDLLYTNYDYMSSTSEAGVQKISYNTNYKIPESGWMYVYFDLSAYDYQSSTQYDPDDNYGVNNNKGTNGNYYPAFIQFINGSNSKDNENYTFYIDDITVDYSEVIDDRDAPVISETNVSASVDSSVAINGQTVTNNYLSISSKIADVTTTTNFTGLDYSKAKIYIDGMDMSTSTAFRAANGAMTLSDIYLADGKHEIIFEVADKQNNYTRATKTLVVDGTADNALVTVTGRNNLNATPKAGSLYYLDVKASDISKIDKIETAIKVNTVNTIELDHITAAENVSYTYEFDKVANTVTLDITNNSTLTGEQTLVTIPVRVWSWSEEVTGIPAATQSAKTTTPIVKIDCQTTYGKVTYKAGAIGANYIPGFYSEINVATEIDRATAWHIHTETAVEGVAADCTHDGYEGRTYCEGCASIVDWGTTLKATGHTYVLDNGKLVCEDCSDEDTLTGLYKEDEKTYYLINGVAQSGWQYANAEWYYFDATTLEGVHGALKLGPVTYNFTNGKLDSGVWAPTLHGMRYYYGPGYYDKGLKTIDGKQYYFEDGFRLENGYQLVMDISMARTWYYFGEDGSWDQSVEIKDGFYTDRNGYAYSKDGLGLNGLHLIDGTYYYFDYFGYAVKNGTYAGILIGDDYKAYTGLLEKDGVIYYYENGKTGSYGLTEFDGAYYLVNWGGVVMTGKNYVSVSNCDLPAGEYTAGVDGKLINGAVEQDGGLYFYENGKTVAPGLYKNGDDYYLVSWGGVALTGKHYANTTYCDLPAGNYEFGADGKMLNGIVEKGGKLYYYDHGVTGAYGLTKYNDAYYNVYWGGEIRTGRRYVDTTLCDLPAGNYEFGEDGKMLNGIVEKDGTLYYYVNGLTGTYGLVEWNGDYYFVYWGGVVKTGKHYVGTTLCDLPVGNYEFGADGKMLNGIVEKDGTLYHYVNGLTGVYGLIECDGDNYLVNWGGLVMTGKQYASVTYCDLPVGNYEFDVDGKMLNGLVEKDGVTYYYDNGLTGAYGLTKYEDAYYFVNWGGVITTGSQYVGATNCDLPAGNYEFGEDGKMLDGFVNKDGVLYYYVNGATAPYGLMELDGEFYFVNWGGKLVTSQTFYVPETEGYTIPMNYTFDELGRVVK